jgi:hypothetical protein
VAWRLLITGLSLALVILLGGSLAVIYLRGWANAKDVFVLYVIADGVFSLSALVLFCMAFARRALTWRTTAAAVALAGITAVSGYGLILAAPLSAALLTLLLGLDCRRAAQAAEEHD